MGIADTKNFSYDLQPGSRMHLFANEGGRRLTSRHFNMQIDAARHNKGQGAVWGDYDNDGDLDLHVPIGEACSRPECFDRTHPMLLLPNDEGC